MMQIDLVKENGDCVVEYLSVEHPISKGDIISVKDVDGSIIYFEVLYLYFRIGRIKGQGKLFAYRVVVKEIIYNGCY